MARDSTACALLKQLDGSIFVISAGGSSNSPTSTNKVECLDITDGTFNKVLKQHLANTPGQKSSKISPLDLTPPENHNTYAFSQMWHVQMSKQNTI